jgi:hypothetical protein
VKFCGYAGTKAEILFVEFCNVVQFRVFVNDLICYYIEYNSFTVGMITT